MQAAVRSPIVPRDTEQAAAVDHLTTWARRAAAIHSPLPAEAERVTDRVGMDLKNAVVLIGLLTQDGRAERPGPGGRVDQTGDRDIEVNLLRGPHGPLRGCIILDSLERQLDPWVSQAHLRPLWIQSDLRVGNVQQGGVEGRQPLGFGAVEHHRPQPQGLLWRVVHAVTVTRPVWRSPIHLRESDQGVPGA